MRLYIAVLDEVPDYIVPTLVAHSVLGAHLHFSSIVGINYYYRNWLEKSFKKCVVRVNRKEFNKISAIPYTYLGYENTTLNGDNSCAIPLPTVNEQVPNVLKFAKLWKPKAC